MAKVITVSKYKGWYILPKGSDVNIREKPTLNSAVLINIPSGDYAGIHIGKQIQFDNALDWIPVLMKNKKLGYVRIDVVNVSKNPPDGEQPTGTPTKQDAMDVIQKLVATDLQIYKRLVTIGVLLNQLKRKGYDVDSKLQLWKKLVSNYIKRQHLLRNSKALDVEDYKGKVVDWAWRNRQWLSWGTISGLGAVWIPVAIGIVIGIAVVGTLYYVFKPVYDESKRDLKITGAFKEWLEKLPAGVRSEITTDLEKQIDDAYNAGLTQGSWKGAWGVVKYPIIIFGSFWAVTKGLEYMDKKRGVVPARA